MTTTIVSGCLINFQTPKRRVEDRSRSSCSVCALQMHIRLVEELQRLLIANWHEATSSTIMIPIKIICYRVVLIYLLS